MSRMLNETSKERRTFLRAAAATTGLLLPACAARGRAPQSAREHAKELGEAEVTPGEDLMQEHGVLERILLVYDEAARRIDAGDPPDLSVVARGASLIRRFIEDYHEKLEEEFVFPRLQMARRESELMAILLVQHQRGRRLTDDIIRRAGMAPSPELAHLLRRFGEMYRPHAAREETVLFPAFRAVIGHAGYRELGEQFEHKEHALFGEHGFRETVGEVAELETALGIADLASFMPP